MLKKNGIMVLVFIFWINIVCKNLTVNISENNLNHRQYLSLTKGINIGVKYNENRLFFNVIFARVLANYFQITSLERFLRKSLMTSLMFTTATSLDRLRGGGGGGGNSIDTGYPAFLGMGHNCNS